MEDLEQAMIENPVIAAVRNDEDVDKVLESNAQIVFVLYGDIMSIATICNRLNKNNKKVFVHMDLIEGLKGDAAGVRYMKEFVKPEGIISTRPATIKHANQTGLFTILRIFVVDSHSLDTGIRNIVETKPNAVEVMPGIAAKIIHELNKRVKVDIIAGGLIKDKKDVFDSLSAGAMAISTTNGELWEM